MTQVIYHPASERGHAHFGWLDTYHSFSFGNYYDPRKMGHGALRVLNDDTIEPSAGFDTHPHKDMEIVTIPLSGKIKHKDSTGQDGLIHTDEVQLMTAGRGIWHSEFNGSSKEKTAILQIWVHPKELGLDPAYQQQSFPARERLNRWQTLVSPDGEEGSLKIHQDAFFSRSFIEEQTDISYKTKIKGNKLFLYVIDGEVCYEDYTLGRRDALALSDLDTLSVCTNKDSDLLLIEVP